MQVKVLLTRSTEELTPKNTWRQLRKQECIAADFTGKCRVVLWQKHIGALTEEQSYLLKNVTVRSFGDCKYISVSDKSTIEKTEDLGAVSDLSETDVVEGEVVGIISSTEYCGCINCGAKATTQTDDSQLAECTIILQSVVHTCTCSTTHLTTHSYDS